MVSKQRHKNLDGIDPVMYKRRWSILIALCIALLGVMLANSSMNIALPILSVDLGISQLMLTWIVNIYTLLFASLLFLAGAIGDRYGRKLALQIGAAIFTASALYAGFFANSGTELVIARAIMGLGGALVMPTTLSIIDNVFPKNERARAIAIWSAIAGVGMMFGNVVSGVLLEFFSWHSLFYFSAIVSGIGILINQIVVRENRDAEKNPVDWLGGVLAAVGIFGVVYGITEAPSTGITDGVVLASLISGIVALVVFVWWELRTKSPILDMKLFKNRAFSVSSLTLTLTFLAMMGVFYSMSQLQQLILGMSPLVASLSMIPMMLPMMLLAPLVPNIVKKIGARFAMGGGLLLVVVAFLIMATWTADITYWHMLGTMMLLMTGVTLTMTPGTNILMASVPRNRAGMGSAMNDTTRELGATLGIATLGAILSAAYVRNISDTASSFAEPIQSALESSLAIALATVEELGPQAAAFADAAKTAWMDALSTSALVAAGIIFVAAVIALTALPKHVKAKNNRSTSDTI